LVEIAPLRDAVLVSLDLEPEKITILGSLVSEDIFKNHEFGIPMLDTCIISLNSLEGSLVMQQFVLGEIEN
jgi:hypothetical protein